MAEKLKIISLGGLNEIGKNLTVYEYGGDIIVVDELTLSEGKTKLMANVLKKLGAEKKALIVMPEKNEQFIKSAANIPGVKTALVNTLNTYDVLNAGKFIIAKDAVAKLEEVYA